MESATGINEETRRAFVGKLYQTVIEAGDRSLPALEELSNIAFGGYRPARRLIKEIDGKVSAGELVLLKTR